MYKKNKHFCFFDVKSKFKLCAFLIAILIFCFIFKNLIFPMLNFLFIIIIILKAYNILKNSKLMRFENIHEQNKYSRYYDLKLVLEFCILLIWIFTFSVISTTFDYLFKNLTFENLIFSTFSFLPLFIAIALTKKISKKIKSMKPEDYITPPGSYIGPWGLYTPVNPPTPPSTKPQNSNIDHIEKLKDLTQMLEKGYITRAEFEEQKQDILRRRP